MKGTEYRVGDLIKLVRRPVEVLPNKTYHEIGLRSFGYGVFHKPPISGEELGAKRVFYIEPGDLLFSNVFAWEGAVALASEQEAGKIGSHRFMTYTVDTRKANPYYLLNYFYGGPGLQLIREASPGSAGRNRTLGISNFERQRIDLPPLDEQNRIAERLTSAQRRITTTKTLREKSKRLRLALYDSIFSSIQQWRPLEDGLTLSLDQVAVSQTATYPMAGVYGFGRGIIERDEIAGSDTKYTRFNRLHSDMLLVSRLKAFEGAVTIVPKRCDGRYVSPEFPTFSTIPGVLTPSYLGHLCRWPRLWELLSKESKGIGARRERVSPSRLLATEVPLPSLSTQERVANLLGKSEAALQIAHDQEVFLSSLRPALLDAAFSDRL